jgi:hypothetical protein
MILLNISWKNWLLLNGILFVGFFMTMFSGGMGIAGLIHAFLGLGIFSLSGMNVAVILNSVLKDRFDAWELLSVGVVGSFFFTPTLIFIIYKIFGWITGMSILLAHLLIFALLVFVKLFIRDHVR